MTEFFQQLINGLALGSIFALIALGYTMVYGVLRFINFAHGDVFMIGAFAGFYVAPKVTSFLEPGSVSSTIVVLLIAMAACAILGILIEFLAYRPLRSRPKLTVLITAIGVSFLLEYGGQLVFGPNPKAFELMPAKNIQFFGLTVTTHTLLVFGVAAFLLVSLQFIVKKTKVGTAMRALSFNPQAAALMGINNNHIISFTFGLGSALAGAGGILYAMNYPSIDPLMGIMPGLKAFVAAVLGGIGNIPGAALGGLIIGVTETLVAGSGGSVFRDGIAFAVLIFILLFKPSGILGKTEVEKV